MKDKTKQYTVTIRARKYTYVAHSTKSAARASVNEHLNPCLVAHIDDEGEAWYDAYPHGHPLPDDALVIERCILTASGMRWRVLPECNPYA